MDITTYIMIALVLIIIIMISNSGIDESLLSLFNKKENNTIGDYTFLTKTIDSYISENIKLLQMYNDTSKTQKDILNRIIENNKKLDSYFTIDRINTNHSKDI